MYILHLNTSPHFIFLGCNIFEHGMLSSISTTTQSYHNCSNQTKQKCKKRKGTEFIILIKIPRVRHQKT